MPRGIKGYRWVETGHDVHQLEDTPRHFRGVSSCTCDPDCYSWWIRARGLTTGGESPTRSEAKREVERRVISARPVEPVAG